ncbi:uncharacterized protein K460DRAFT_410020 [Cucurbitaria berberidis CBS 394.84]|uniref:Uncharacterized protein n=1 Tax=Cucurbitaria berberidis CBS 394.84 TaxID=1168544 RepID=A0A9P4GC41_9PLEO|nr:uncharacterized protein K460DRAFT_410020 [Cucurbitaria berberidis CBS 394.84]KAF1842621.1 hypothetical protein K460DRAFT_410020 [Cucurbitaria berberidis CBS 394.84]
MKKKKKANSATATPTNGSEEGVGDSTATRTLRRVKTVDFVEKGSESLLSAPSTTVVPERVDMAINQSGILPACDGRPAKLVHRAPSCPNLIRTVKSSLVDPAITRTDVHVLTIAPSWSAEDTASEGADPATPTMQIVESKNGCYEVVWDDVPADQSIRVRRRSSSACHALEMISPSARGLERVNTKLSDWSATWNSPSGSFKPTIVVFPDDDGRASLYECSVDDDEDLVVLAPPNSQITSRAPSRLPSRPASAPMTRVASHEDMALSGMPQPDEQDEQESTDRAEQLVVSNSNPDSPPERSVDANRRMNWPPAPRKLSNIEEADLKFRGHRDSVTIAHSRLLHSGGIAPELFTHRDSTSMAKKRMHARNHAAAASAEGRRRSHSYDAQSAGLRFEAVGDLPTVTEHGTQPAPTYGNLAARVCL